MQSQFATWRDKETTKYRNLSQGHEIESVSSSCVAWRQMSVTTCFLSCGKQFDTKAGRSIRNRKEDLKKKTKKNVVP